MLARLHQLVVPVGALHEPNLQRLRPLEAPSRCQDCLTLVGGVTQVCLEHDANGRTILKLLLAKQLLTGGNVLLLDEPTNDLDVDTLRALEDALEAFPGCAVVISHDRWFLDRIATHILAWEGTSSDPATWFWFEGNFADYEKNKLERLGADAARPHAVTYRKLNRD